MVFSAVEAVINTVLDSYPQGIKKSRNNQHRDDDKDRRFLIAHSREQSLKADYQAQIDQRQDTGHDGILQRASDNDVNGKQPVA